MRNKIIVILSISVVCTFVLLNQKENTKSLSVTRSANPIIETIDKSETDIVQAQIEKEETQVHRDEVKEVSNSKVSSLLIEHFDDEFGSEIQTKIKVIGDKVFNKILMKVVRISHQKSSGIQSSYLAIVNPSNGKILKTWSKSKIERFRPDPNEFVGFRLPGSN